MSGNFLRGLLLAAGLTFALYAHAERNLSIQSAKTGDGRRVALIIGNGSYKESPLKNPTNDAEDVAASLKSLGFEVISRKNAGQRDMKGAIREFGQKLRGAEAGLFFFAGHGLQVRGINYLVPVAADIESEADAEDQAVSLDYVMRTMEEGGAKFNVAILDACRNNPFARSFRSASRGLAQTQAATGTLIAYATAPGSVAADGDGRNGIYTKHLLKSMTETDGDILRVFQKVRTGVVQETGGKQTPWESISLVGDFYFKPGQGTQVASLVPVPAAPGGGGVSLDDIRQQQEAKAKWDKWQAAMQADFDKVAALNAVPELMITAWDRFLASYTQKNPFSDDDEQLRNEARNRKQLAEAEKQRRVARPVAATTTAGSKSFRDCADCPEMVPIPGKDYALGKTEITQAQWRAVMGNNPSKFRGCDDCPVEQVSWHDAQEFLRQLSARTGKTYRLPSETEWEYACNAGSPGNCFRNDMEAVAWWEGNSGGRTHPVARKQANGFGLHDMAGNVWEWTEECDGWSCSERVLRGSAWNGHPETSNRSGMPSAFRGAEGGFRPVRTLP